jgi:hypothetical protein
MSALEMILLQKSKVATAEIFGENVEREEIADSHGPSRATAVACEFSVRRQGPSDTYIKAAPTVRRIFDHLCKTTFATISRYKQKGPEQTTTSEFDP